MYVRTISRKNKDDCVVEYVQLAHDYRDPKSGFAQAEVIYSFAAKTSSTSLPSKGWSRVFAAFSPPKMLLKHKPLPSRTDRSCFLWEADPWAVLMP